MMMMMEAGIGGRDDGGYCKAVAVDGYLWSEPSLAWQLMRPCST